MFDIGFWEIFLLMILALLVIGPERLPGAARTVGRWFGKARRYVEGVKSEVEQEFDVTEFRKILRDQENQISDLQQQLTAKVDVDDLDENGDIKKRENDAGSADTATKNKPAETPTENKPADRDD